ncbi:uncharacterized protein B0J16DRAFT_2495 [Fusarium flagelliforme]|uniref:uncharacterized protein n=1 Tax=Fusarium flagelliforme TaxID=2675880 RepID=UPI001E8EDFBC|nr:uncharacterized protein B0J16DRAFT_2495 [Fusarium flagelliforme]KAH7196588.1 hypothetical protein B0J16DRAFT_2495 [Fusarium flagelliforme]
MSPASSPSRDVTEPFSRRRGINIPSDQKGLLEKQDSWAVDLQNQRHGLVNIPGSVLEGAKAAYLAQKKRSQQQTPQGKKRGASPGPSRSSNRKRMRNGDGNPSVSRSNFDKPPQSSPERSIPWSPSPSRDQNNEANSIKVLINPTTQSSIAHETPKTITVGPPPRTLRPMLEDPPMSDESEDDMETRIPDAQPLRNVPINRIAVRSHPSQPTTQSTGPMATPPCAQPSNPTQSIVPETVMANRAPSKANGSPGKGRARIVFKPIDVDDVGRKRKRSHPEKERLAPTIMPPVIDSSMPSSESCIPNTYCVPTTQESIRESIEGNEEDDGDESAEQIEEIIPSTNDEEVPVKRASNRRPASAIKPRPVPEIRNIANQNGPTVQQQAKQHRVQPQAQEKQVQQQPQRQTAQKPTTPQTGPQERTASTNSRKLLESNELVRRSQLPVPPRIAPGAPHEPFETFVQQYPRYASGNDGQTAPGTKLSFIEACLYLNYLRPKSLLRDCLYDDFIRAFPYFKEYVDRAGRSAMVAIKWFNKQKGPPLFNKYLVHRGNLSHILRSCPEEFNEANQKIYKRKDDDELSIYTSSNDEGGSSEEEENLSSPVSKRSSRKDLLSSATKKTNGKTADDLQPVETIESDTEMEISEMLPVREANPVRRSSGASVKRAEHHTRSNPTSSVSVKTRPAPPLSSKARRTIFPAQPESSRAQDIMTQAPPPPSPKIPDTSMLPPSTAPNSTSGWKAPRPSQYLETLVKGKKGPGFHYGASSSNRFSSSNQVTSSPVLLDEKRRDRLRAHFRKSLSAQKAKNGTKPQNVRSSSGQTR